MSHADVVVVGAGVIGSSIAYQLSARGMDVIVVDKGAGVGHGSTSASSAVVRFNYSTFDSVALAWEAFHSWANWREYLHAPRSAGVAELHQVGGLVLDSAENALAESYARLQRAGVRSELWTGDEIRRNIAGLDVGRFDPPKRLDDKAFWEDAEESLQVALYMPNAGYVDDPMFAAQNMADAAARHGVRFELNRTVVAVNAQVGRVVGVSLHNGDRLDAPVVVNAAGPWSTALNELAGVGADWRVSSRPLRQEVHHVSAPTDFSRDDRPGPWVGDLDTGVYFRPTPGDALLIGGTEPACDELEWVEDPDVVDLAPTRPVFEAQVTRAARRMPGLGVPSQVRGITGVYDATPDWCPIYDRTELEGYYVSMGTSGNQFKNAPVVGELMAELISHVEGGGVHDQTSLTFTCAATGNIVDLATFSRRRVPNTSSGTVMG